MAPETKRAGGGGGIQDGRNRTDMNSDSEFSNGKHRGKIKTLRLQMT